MNHWGETRWPRRRLLVSGISLLGSVLTLGSMSLLSGCGDEKGGGQVENPVDPTKTQSGMDSMKATLEQMKQRKAKTK
jgi:hypothetical protein